jgi:hypothetical protein
MEYALIGLLSFVAGALVCLNCKLKIDESEAEDRGYDRGFDEGTLIAQSAIKNMENRGMR